MQIELLGVFAEANADRRVPTEKMFEVALTKREGGECRLEWIGRCRMSGRSDCEVLERTGVGKRAKVVAMGEFFRGREVGRREMRLRFEGGESDVHCMEKGS